MAFTDIERLRSAEGMLREREAALGAQQASLRRVAALVASGAASADVFEAVAEEVGRVTGLPLIAVWRYEPDSVATVIGAWSDEPHPFVAGTHWPLDGPTICARVLATGAPVRIDDFAGVTGVVGDAARAAGIRACAGAPIVVDGDVWGAMSADSTGDAPLPDDIEDRLVGFTDLLAATFSTSARQAELARLAEEQAALRRVATLVARGVAPADVFAAVVREVATVLDVNATHMGRYDADGTVTAVSAWSRDGAAMPLGTSTPLDPTSVSGLVFTTGRPARKDHYDDASTHIAAVTRQLGIRSAVAAPIVVDGRLWGVMIASSNDDRPLAADTESRIAAFTELVAAAVSNTEARTETARLADQQAALRRVATLVAQGVAPSRLFAAVAEEVGTLLGADFAGMIRYEADEMVTPVAAWAAVGEHPAVPDHWPVVEDDPATIIEKTRGPARTDDWGPVPGPLAAFARDTLGIRSSVGSPIFVEGRLWGALAVHSKQAEPLPADAESRLLSFTELVGTAVANAQARAEVQRLADEQAALRRVATLVASDSPAGKVLGAVAEEVGRLLGADATATVRFEADGMGTVIAVWGDGVRPLGARTALDDEHVGGLVLRTGRPARIDEYADAGGEIGARRRAAGYRSAVGSPIVVDGQLWGVMIAVSKRPEPMPPDTESRIGEFTELVATAISNVQARSDLAASRARVVAAADDERRRVVRDLHDGAQQRLVHSIISLKVAQRELEPEQVRAAELVREALGHAERANVELRELAHGILPAVLTQGGLRVGVEALALRMPVPVDVSVSVDRLPAPLEATAYFVVAEALTNVAKHADATRAWVGARVEDRTLELRVHDDGIGGARPDGSGLVGLADRLAALEGQLWLDSPAGGGTRVAADIPIRG
jgi:GAF domain-containing protein